MLITPRCPPPVASQASICAANAINNDPHSLIENQKASPLAERDIASGVRFLPRPPRLPSHERMLRVRVPPRARRGMPIDAAGLITRATNAWEREAVPSGPVAGGIKSPSESKGASPRRATAASQAAGGPIRLASTVRDRPQRPRGAAHLGVSRAGFDSRASHKRNSIARKKASRVSLTVSGGERGAGY